MGLLHLNPWERESQTYTNSCWVMTPLPEQVTSPTVAFQSAFCNYLALEAEGLEEKDFQSFRNEAVKLFSSIQSSAEQHGRQSQQSQQQTLTKLKCNFNIYATDIVTTTAASTSCKGIHLNHPKSTDAFKPSHPTCSA